MGLTRLVLKRPVATVMTLLCLLVFGISPYFQLPWSRCPTDTPMLIVMEDIPAQA